MTPLNHNRTIIKDYSLNGKVILKEGDKVFINYWYPEGVVTMSNITCKRKNYNIPYHYISIT